MKKRKWVWYSPFSSDDNGFASNVYSDWKNAAKRMSTHEISNAHTEVTITFKGNRLLNTINEGFKDAKYVSFSVHSTPDMSHVDKLFWIFRFVLGNELVGRLI